MENTNLIVTPESAATAGTISYWRLAGQVNIARLTSRWTQAGLNEKELPKPPGRGVALGRAVRMEGGPRMLVRPLDAESTWALLQETAGADVIAHRHLCVVSFDGTDPVFTRVNATPAEYEPIVARIRQNFDKQTGELAPEDISMWLVKVAKRLNAVPLRDTGGIYFVPRSNAELWRKVAKVIEGGSQHSVFQIPAMRNDEAVRAITDAVTQEAEAAVAAITTQLNELGERALKARREACDALLVKIAEYDSLLGTQLKCRESVSELKASIAAALLVVDEAA